MGRIVKRVLILLVLVFGGQVLFSQWQLLSAPVTETQYLHAADVVVSSSTFNTINTGSTTGSVTTASASIGSTGVVTLQNGSSISIFASDAVPGGYIWDIGGSWTFNAYVYVSSTAGTGYMRAKVYKIDTSGATTLLYTTAYDDANALANGSYTLMTWTDTIPSNLLSPGERFGVEFLVNVTNRDKNDFVYLGFDGNSPPSSPDSNVVVTYTQDLNVGTVRQAHYRIGKDEPLTTMKWLGGVDQRATNLRRNVNYRIRFQVYNNGGTDKNWQPQLEWSATSGSGYSQLPTTSASAPFFVADTSQFSNGAAITTGYFALGTGTGTSQNGLAYDTENPPASPITLYSGNYTEVEFNIQPNDNASFDTSYYFRLTDNGVVLKSYDVTEAELRMQPAPSVSDPHNTYAATTDKCAVCHRPHTSIAPSLRQASTEEGVCLSCHDSSGATTDISSQIAKTYQHPLADTTFTHSANETSVASFSGANRHVECEDCHLPHATWPGLHDPGSNIAGLVTNGASGVSVNNISAWTAPDYTFVSDITYSYELCLKCHSSWAYGGSPPNTPSGFWDVSGANITAAQTDPSVEFNTLNRAHHAVEGTGRNQPPVTANPNWPANGLGLSNNFVSPWTATSTVQCNDCHASDTGSEPDGPHGSSNRWLLRGNETGSGSPNNFCYNCHRREVYGDVDTYEVSGDDVSGNDYHLWSRFPHRWYLAENGNHVDSTQYNRWGIWCMSCHGGDVLGGIHGTNRSDTGTGTTVIGKRFLNGAAIAGWVAGTTTTDSGEIRTKSSTDEVNLCTKHSGGKAWTANYDYAP